MTFFYFLQNMCYDEAKFLEEAKHQELVLDFIQGNQGLPILYDSFFKTIMDPTNTPEHLESFLSLLLNQKVTISDVLPEEGSQLTELGSLVIMDIIVQLEDGSYVDVEMQKYGYAFTGERSTCYLSDLIFISLDTFHMISQNIDTELDAWLTFLSSNTPKDILLLVQKYPNFVDYYREISEFRQKPRELMSMFSKALLQMDKNTANYMIEEQAKEYEAKLAEKDAILAEKDATLAEKDATLAELESRITELEKQLKQQK